jgi:hypothetical protein
VFVCLLRIGTTLATMCESNVYKVSEVLVKLAEGNSHFTTSIYKASGSCLTDGNGVACNKLCAFV